MSSSPPPSPIPLATAELLALEGSDAVAFGQAQFTSDVNALAVGTWQWSAWLDALGRTRHFFALLRTDAHRLLVWQPLGSAEQMRAELARFVFRAKVSLHVLPDHAVHALAFADRPALGAKDAISHRGGFAITLPGGGDRVAWLAPADGRTLERAALAEWRALDVAAGLPWIAPSSTGLHVPQALDLERLDAIRFDKGCYPGQEIAARLHFRGGNKRRLRRMLVEGEMPDPAEEVLDGERPVGHILYAAPHADGTTSALGVVVDTQSAPEDPRTSRGARIVLKNSD